MLKTKIKALIVHSGDSRYLSNCLTSLRNVVTEAVVCLNNDTSFYKEIVRELARHKDYFTGRVVDIGGARTFGELRNRALVFAEEGEYILQIDSDERVVGDLRGVQLDADGYRVEVTSPHIQRANYIVVQREYIFRLFKYYSGVRYIFGVHEQISWNYMDKRIQNLSLIKIKHLGYDLSVDEMHKKVLRNFELLKREIADIGEHSYLLYHLGECYLWFGEIEEAIKHYERALDRGEILNEKLNQEIIDKVIKLKRRRSEGSRGILRFTGQSCELGGDSE